MGVLINRYNQDNQIQQEHYYELYQQEPTIRRCWRRPELHLHCDTDNAFRSPIRRCGNEHKGGRSLSKMRCKLQQNGQDQDGWDYARSLEQSLYQR